MTNKKEPVKGTEITIGGYTFDSSYTYNGELWLYGPDGDGMQLGKEAEAALAEIIAKFFKENM